MTSGSERTQSASLGCDSGASRRLHDLHGLRTAMRLNGMAACSLALLLSSPGAAGLELGEANVVSSLGEPLVVDIPLRLTPYENVSPDCISLVRSDRPGSLPAYTAVGRVAVNRTTLRVFGNAVVREPLIGLNVRLTCRTAPKLERSYQLFVDPAGVGGSLVASQPAPSAARPERTAEPRARVPVANRQTPRPTPQPDTAPIDAGSRYVVQVGDTLSGIAARINPRPAGLWATAEAIFDANPAAFVDNDMDRLGAGYTLVIPTFDARDGSASTQSAAATPTETGAATESTPVPSEAASESEAASATTPAVAAERADGVAGELATTLARLDSEQRPETRPDAPTESEPVASEPAPLEQASESPFLSEPAATPGAAADGATSAAADSDPGTAAGDSTWSGWLTGIIALGAALALLVMLLPIVRRRRGDADAESRDFLDDTSLTRVVADGTHFAASEDTDGFEVTEETGTWQQPAAAVATTAAAANLDDGETFRLDDAQNARMVDDSLNDSMDSVADPLSATDDFDLDIAIPPSAPTPDDESLIIEAEVGTELSGSSRSPDMTGLAEVSGLTDLSGLSDVAGLAEADDEADAGDDTTSRSNVTLAELDLLERDYEAEFTATQQLNSELAEAVADLKRTQEEREAEEDLIVTADDVAELDADVATVRADVAAMAKTESAHAAPEEPFAGLWDAKTSESALLMGEEILGSDAMLDIGEPIDDNATAEMPLDDGGPTVEMPARAEEPTVEMSQTGGDEDSGAEFVNLDDWDETVETSATDRRSAG